MAATIWKYNFSKFINKHGSVFAAKVLEEKAV